MTDDDSTAEFARVGSGRRLRRLVVVLADCSGRCVREEEDGVTNAFATRDALAVMTRTAEACAIDDFIVMPDFCMCSVFDRLIE